MAAPVDAGRIVTNMTATRPSTINLPAGIQAGDLLIVAGRGGGTITTLLPAGWSWLVQNDQTDASDDTVSIIYKKADGSEGTSLTWDMGFAIKGCTIAWRITGAEDPAIRAPEVVGASFAAVANTANPPAITPAGGLKEYLFLAIANKDGVQAFTVAPSGYANFIAGSGSTGGQAATNATAAGASKAGNLSTEDPGAFTHGAATTGGRAFTIAIHPATPRSFGVVSLPITFGKHVDGFRTAASLYRAAVLADSPAGYWRLDEASGAALPVVGGFNLSDNASGGGVAGLLLNEPTSKGRRLIAANSSHMSGGAQPFKYNTITWEIWVKRIRTNIYEILIDQYNGGYRLSLDSGGALNLEASYGSTIAQAPTLKILDTNPHHIVVTRNGIGGEVVFYLDGVAEIGTPGASVSHDMAGWPNYALFIGSSWGNSPFDGTLDELAVYPTVLAPARVQNHYDVAAHVATTVYASLALPVSFGATVQGQRKAFGQIARPIIFSKDVRGQRKTFSQIALPVAFSKDVRGQRKTFGQIVFPINASISTAGEVKGITIFGALSLPVAFGKDIRAQRKTFAQIALPMVFSKQVQGRRKTFGQIALPIVWAKEVIGRRWMYGQITRPFFFGSVIQGRRRVRGKIALPMYFAIDVNSGHVGAHGQLIFPIVFDARFTGLRTHGAIILNEATAIYLGTQQVDAVYTDGQKIWPPT